MPLESKHDTTYSYKSQGYFVHVMGDMLVETVSMSILNSYGANGHDLRE